MKSIIYALAASILAACHAPDGHQDEKQAEHGHKHAGEIVMDTEAQHAEGVKAEAVKARTFAEVLHTSGRIVGSSAGTVQQCAVTSGVVTGMSIVAGSRVTQGQTLLTITSLTQQGESVRVELEEAEATMRRLERLATERLVGADELEAARTRLRQAQVAAKGISVEIKATATGTIQLLACSAGQYVEAGQLLALVTTGCNANIEAYVPQRYASHTYTAARFSVGDSLCTTSTLVGRTTQVDANGCVSATFSGVPPTAPVGAYCEVWLIGAQRENVLAVPLTALTEDQGTHYIYTKDDAHSFSRHAVTLGDSDGKHVEILSGVKTGDRVVTEGVYAVRAAGQSAAIPGHTHNH